MIATAISIGISIHRIGVTHVVSGEIRGSHIRRAILNATELPGAQLTSDSTMQGAQRET